MQLFLNYFPTHLPFAKSDSDKYYLKTEDNLWTLKAVKPNINLANYLNLKVQILGNLTKEANLVEVSEIIPLNPQTSPASPTTLTPSNPPNPPADVELPEVYSALDWQTTQKRTRL